MRSLESTPNGEPPSAGSLEFAVELLGNGERPRRHFPDLVIEGDERVAVELELAEKAPQRLGGILRAYSAADHIDRVLYVAERRGTRRRLAELGEAVGLGDRLEVRESEPAVRPMAGRG